MTAYYIDGTGGSEANDGLSESSPKRDWSESIGRANGDIVNLRSGTTINMTVSNAVTGNYTIQAYGDGPKPVVLILDYATTHMFANAAAKGPVVAVRGIKFVRVDTGSIPAGGDNVPVGSIGAETLVFEDCEVEGKFQHGVRVGWGDNASVRRNKITGPLNCGIYVGITGKSAPSFGVYEGNTILVPDATNDCITLHDGSGSGIGNRIVGNYMLGGVENNVDVQAMFADTYIGRNRLIAGPLSGSSGSGNAVVTVSSRSVIERNVIESITTSCLELVNTNCSGSVIRRNMVLGPTGIIKTGGGLISHLATNINPIYRNNTFVGRAAVNPGRSMFQFYSSTPTMEFTNNAVVKSALDSYGAFFWLGNAGPVGAFDHNRYFMPAVGSAQYCGKTLASFKATFSTDTNSSELLLSALPAALDSTYRPLLASTVFRAGVYVGSSLDPDGTEGWIPPSIGAYEYVTARPLRQLP